MNHHTIAEERRTMRALLAQEQQGSALEQHLDAEMRLILAQYDDLEVQRAHLLLGDKNPTTQRIELILNREMALRAKLEVLGILWDVHPVVIAACTLMISQHYSEPEGEGSLEHGYSLLKNYFTGMNLSLFPRLDFFTQEEIYQLLGMELAGREEA